MKFKAGFDIGGSHIAGGLYDGGNNLVARVTEPFPKGRPDETPELIAAMLQRLVRSVCAAGSLESVGLAVPGSIDRAGERVIHAYNLGFHDYPLRARAAALVGGVPVCVGNDADAATLAELHAGALRGAQCAVLMTLGTGVGGGIIINGKLWHGGMGNGCEIGHFVMDMSGEICSCGVRGCCETRASATALSKAGAKAAEEHPESLLGKSCGGDISGINARIVIDCARKGDAEALRVFDEYTDALSSAAASIINILDPEIIAFGGGVSAAGEFLFAPVREKTANKSFYSKHASIVPAILGNDAGMLGAALLHMDAQ